MIEIERIKQDLAKLKTDSRVPDLLRAVREAIVRLEELTGLHTPDNQCTGWISGDTQEQVWQRLISVQCSLMLAERDDTEEL